MEFAALILSGIGLAASLLVLILLLRPTKSRELSELRRELNEGVQSSIGSFGKLIADNLQKSELRQEQRFTGFEQANEQKLESIRQTMERRLINMQMDNNERLTAMQQVVDEKLQKTLEAKMTQSFQLVSTQLKQVYEGLGEMQQVAVGVTDLKKVLSNVKSRGILGEIQLGAILSEILTPEQYETNACVVPGSRERVEYAIRVPANEEQTVYLPIDAKFPGDAYAALQDAYDSGVREQVDAAAAVLIRRLKDEAKDIRKKYIAPPHTTDYAILFLPFEGLYAEAVNRGMIEVLQREYRVNLAGPSTMAALLNSLQIVFRTLAVQKRSGEVWEVLGAVKTEFDNFATVLEKSQANLMRAHDELEKLVGTRTNVIRRKLREVERLDENKASELLLP